MSDNFHFDLTDVPLTLCLQVAFGPTPMFGKGCTAIGWAEVPAQADHSVPSKTWGAGKDTPLRLVLFRYPNDAMQPFPSPMTAEQVQPMVEAWLAQATYGPEPDHDGSNEKGWRVYNEEWTHVATFRTSAFVAIEPIWLLHGK